jgi:uncharacterized protein with WD repeat
MMSKTCVPRFMLQLSCLLLASHACPALAQQDSLAALGAHAGGVDTVSFSPDSKLLASGGVDQGIKLWDVVTREEKHMLIGHKGTISSLGFSPDGKLLASGSSDRTIKLWDVATGKEQATLKEVTNVRYPSLPYSIAFSPDGKTLASSGHSGVKLWNMALRQDQSTPTGQLPYAYQVAFSPNGKNIAILTEDGTMACLNLGTAEESVLYSPLQSRARCLAFNKDNKTVAVGGDEYRIALLDITTGREISILKGEAEIMPPPKYGHGPPTLVYSVAFSPDGKLLASASYDCAIKLWDVATRNKLTSLKGHTDLVWSVAFSPDGKLLASGGYDGTVRLWKIDSAK